MFGYTKCSCYKCGLKQQLNTDARHEKTFETHISNTTVLRCKQLREHEIVCGWTQQLCYSESSWGEPEWVANCIWNAYTGMQLFVQLDHYGLHEYGLSFTVKPWASGGIPTMYERSCQARTWSQCTCCCLTVTRVTRSLFCHAIVRLPCTSVGMFDNYRNKAFIKSNAHVAQ